MNLLEILLVKIEIYAHYPFAGQNYGYENFGRYLSVYLAFISARCRSVGWKNATIWC